MGDMTNGYYLAMTVAYLAIGAKDALEAACRADPLLEIDGEYEYISEVVQFAAIVDDVWRATDRDSHSGFFPYAVIEPFGRALGERILRGEAMTLDAARALLHDVVVSTEDET